LNESLAQTQYHEKIITLLLITAALIASAKSANNNSGKPNSADSTSTGTNANPVGTNSVLLNSFQVVKNILQSTTPAKAVLAYTKQLRPLEIYYFPGTAGENALVIGGVHGSELSSVSVARQLIELLSNSEVKPYYNVIVIPSLFLITRRWQHSIKAKLAAPPTLAATAMMLMPTLTGKCRRLVKLSTSKHRLILQGVGLKWKTSCCCR
jgi:hypothetical protein